MPGEETGTDAASSSSSSKEASKITSNTTSLTQSIEKLDGSMATGQSNYNAWRFRIVRILKEKDLLPAIEDSTVSSTKDDQAFTIITLNIKDSQIPHIQNATTSREAWAALKEVHQGIATNGRMVLMQRLWALKMSEGQDMAKHLNLFRELANQLRGLSTEGKEVDDSELLTILTLSLPESYEPLVMALQSRSDIITFDMMAGRLLLESARRHIGQVTHKGSENNNTIGSQTTFSANRPPTNYPFRTNQGGFYATSRGRGGFHGSTRRFSGRRGGSLNRRVNMVPSGNLNRTQQGTKCFYCRKTGHWKKDCYKRKSEESGNRQTGLEGLPKSEFTFLAEDTDSAPKTGWIIDSGASQHLCRSRAAFTTYTKISNQQAITIANRTKIMAIGVGAIEIVAEGESFALTDVWHVPDIGGNLMAVSRIVDAGYTIACNPHTCTISKNGVQTTLGTQFGNLYYLNNISAHNNKHEKVEANLGLITNQSPAASIEV